MKIDKCLYICHNREDVIFLQRELFKNNVGWSHGIFNTVDIFETKYVPLEEYPVYMGIFKGHISWTTSNGIEYSLRTLYINYSLININILKRKEKLEKLNDI